MDDGVGAAGDRVLRQRQRIAGALGRGQCEAGIAHAERAPHALLQHAAERLARHRLDDEAQHVGGEAVFPVRCPDRTAAATWRARRSRRPWTCAPPPIWRIPDRARAPAWCRGRGKSGRRCGAAGPGWSAAASARACRRQASATFSSASGGRYFDTGSASSTRPSSTSSHDGGRGHRLGHGGDGEDRRRS